MLAQLNGPPAPRCPNQLGVRDSPRGPLKQLGNPHLKPATKPKPNTPYLTMQDMAHAVEAPAAHQASHSKVPSSRLRLARGCAPTSGGLRPVRGGAPPSSRLRLARGSAPPSNGARLVRGRSARAPAPVRGHLMPWHRRGGTIMPLGLAPRCRHTNSPGGSPSPPLWGGLCGVAGASPVTPCRLLRYG
jgi:hypothetical protein